MNLTRLAIEKNRITWVALAIIAVAGLIAYTRLPRALDPGFTVRTAQILTLFPGASPERVEMLVTDKLEKVVKELPELDFVYSQSTPGVSVVLVNLKESIQEVRPVWDRLRRKVDDVRESLPERVLGPSVNDEFGDTFGVIVTIAGPDFSYAELERRAERVREELLRLDEVAKVEIYGVQEERIFVEYNNATLSRLGLTPIQLQQILEGRNIIIPGGEVSTGVESIAVEPSGNFESVEDLRNTVVRIPGRRELMYLGDIVDIREGYIDPPDTIVSSNGTPALAIAVSMREGGNITLLGDAVQALVERLPGDFEHGIDFAIVNFLPDKVNEKVDDFVSNVLQSVGIVLLVMLVALGLRTGVLVASLIPTTMLMTLMFMLIAGIGLDQMSLASLIIALGLLVDNAIVMTESISVQMNAGKRPLAAAVDSAKELRVPLLTSSLTTAAAFLPIYLANSAVGEYTAPLFKVVSIALLSSWVLAMTMTPMLCALFLRPARVRGGLVGLARRLIYAHRRTEEEAPPAFSGPFYAVYRRSLTTAVRRPWVTVGVVAAVFIGVMSLASRIPQIFFPTIDEKQFTAKLELPPGSDVRYTAAIAAELDEYIEKELLVPDGGDREGVTSWVSFVGGAAPRYALSYNPDPPSPENAFVILNTTSWEVIPELISKLKAFTFSEFPDLDATVKVLSAGPPVKDPVQVRLSGADVEQLFAIAEKVKARLRDIEGVGAISDDWGTRAKKLVVDIDQTRSFLAGMTNQDIAVSLLTYLSGFQTSEYRKDDRIVPIIMRSAGEERRDLGKLETLSLYAQSTGKNVPLGQVADTRVQWEPSRVLRRNRVRTLTIGAQLEPGVTAAQVNTELSPFLDGLHWDLGYRYEIGGEAEASSRANESINAKMPIAGLLILLLLVSQFNSMRRTVIVLITIPLALIGVVIGLLLTGASFGFMTLLGVISLAGIVINNAIVLLERIDIERDENGLSPQQAVLTAAQRRLRPILLTTATTVGGLLPLWFGGGPLWESMAVTIIFGLLFSTFLTLVVVPALYTLLFRIRFQEWEPDEGAA